MQVYAICNQMLTFHGQVYLRIVIVIDMKTASIIPDVYIQACQAHLKSMHDWHMPETMDEYT